MCQMSNGVGVQDTKSVVVQGVPEKTLHFYHPQF